ncbi:MAG: hypothetical protein Q4E33_00940 [Erysipelotrichaceae bacterium]|nr:hypothetical protein [Erysipelotrichaceae bacterium]
MRKVYINDFNVPNLNKNVACIGYFDGVHRGHQALINFTKYLSSINDVNSMVICFDPDPIDVISADDKHLHLLSKKDRFDSFKEVGIDTVCIIKFNKELMNLSPVEFINKFLLKLNIDTLICGYDFHFGYLGKGDYKLLSKYINTVVIEQISYYGKKISSTRIRNAVYEGNFKLASKLLGYDYSLTLKVINIAVKGRKLLVEAICKDKDLIIPKDGNYNGYYIRNRHFYFNDVKDISKNDEILLVFKNE